MLKDGQPGNREERSLSASTVIARWQGNGEPCKSRGLRTVLWAAGGEIPPADPAAWNPRSREILSATANFTFSRGWAKIAMLRRQPQIADVVQPFKVRRSATGHVAFAVVQEPRNGVLVSPARIGALGRAGHVACHRR